MFTLHCLAKDCRMRKQGLRGHPETNDPIASEVRPPISPFSADEIAGFPVLRRRNLWCIQRHLATAPHYDLRLGQREGLFSWAIPKGLMGLSHSETRLAVETTVHPFEYATFEGGDPGVEDRGTLLWDIGFYTIDELHRDPDSETDDSDNNGAFEQEKLSLALSKIRSGKKSSFVVTLRGGQKMINSSFMLVYQPGHDKYDRFGSPKREWFLRLPTNAVGPTWDTGGEDGPTFGRSIKTGRTMKEVCRT